MLELTFHTDIGHGWLEVPKVLVQALQLSVSPFSYVHGDSYFLEEDCDAPAFDAAAAKAGLKFDVVSEHFEGNHPLRNYARVVNPEWKLR
jgi:hypothetical protein